MIDLRPLVSEKSFTGSEKGVYTFKVPHAAAKPEIKRSVESAFKVNVVGIRTAQKPGTVKTRGKIKGLKPGYKKAIVTLKKGETIEELKG